MNKSLLITRPNHDQTTNYLCQWSEGTVRIATEKNFTVYDLKGKKATQKNFESYNNIKKPRLFFLNGHGNADTITVYDNEPIVTNKIDGNSVKNRIIYARSCDAGQSLGKDLVKIGASAFIGYKRKYIFGYTPSKLTRPLEDQLARLFLEPTNLVVTTLLKGHSVEEAQNRSKTAMNKNFRRMISSVASDEEKYAARWLWSNINSQVMFGDEKAALIV